MQGQAPEKTEESVPAGRRRQESERRRQRILAAARACFGRLGFAGAKIETIAAEAGVSNGLLYQFFRNKQNLFEVVVDGLQRDWVRAMVRHDDPPATHAQALEWMFRGSVEFARNHPLLPALMTEDALLELKRFSDLGARRVDAHREHVAGILRAGIEVGEFRADLDIASVADLICQIQVDYSTRAYRRKPGFPAGRALIDAAVRFVHDAVKA